MIIENYSYSLKFLDDQIKKNLLNFELQPKQQKKFFASTNQQRSKITKAANFSKNSFPFPVTNFLAATPIRDPSETPWLHILSVFARSTSTFNHFNSPPR